MSTLKVTNIQSNGAGFNDVVSFQNSSGTQNGTLCRTWVNFNGTGTVAIRAQFNVSSITDNGTGDYTVNFATAMPDANYSIAGASSGATAGVAGNFSVGVRQDGVTASACRLSVYSTNNTATDTLIVATSIFR
jgi:hypothetical protein